MKNKSAVSKEVIFRMKPKIIQKANYADLLKNRQIGPNGQSKKWLELAQSNEMISILEKKGSFRYIKELKHKLASKGFYKEFLE